MFECCEVFIAVKIAILGFGREGKAILNFFKKSERHKSAKIEILDKKINRDYLRNLGGFDVIYRSPGIPYALPEIQKAKKAGVEISSATDLFFAEARKIGCKIVGVTGTKGKSTTSTLIYKMLRAYYEDRLRWGKSPRTAFGGPYLAGNIGKPALNILPKLSKRSLVVLELSSFQLQTLRHSPHIAVILGLFPDHMDAHKNFKEYAGAKANIAKWQKGSDAVFYASENKYAAAIARKSPGKRVALNYCAANSRESGGEKFEDKIRELIRIPGGHQLKNALMAAEVARHLKVSEKIILKTIAAFRGLPHRLEFIRKIRAKHRHISSKVLKNFGTNAYISFYNDSAATNPHTAAAAIKSFKNPVILIAGGKDKDLDYGPLAAALKKSTVRYVVLYGKNRNKIDRAVRQSAHGKWPMVLRKDLKSSVLTAYKLAKLLATGQTQPTITILLSPASASFDQFKDYKERGKMFKKLVKNLKI